MTHISPTDPVFQASDSDASVSPSDDFYRFANGGWLDSNPVPDEYGSWGAAHEVHARNEAQLKTLLESAVDAGAETGSVEQMVGDYYRSGMDIDAIEGQGVAPIEPWLERIDSVGTVDDIRNLVAEFHSIGVSALFGTSVIPDFEDPEVNLLYVDQGGLGLPDRDYYLRDDETSLALLTSYRSHISNMFILAGLDGTDETAKAVLAIETAIADASFTSVQVRDVDLITNKRTMDKVAELMPGFDLVTYLDLIGAGDEASVNVDNVDFYPVIDKMLGSTSIADWKLYLTWNLLRSTSTALPESFGSETFEFYGKTLGGQKEQKPRWKRVLAMGSGDIGELISQLYVAEHFPPESKRAMEQLVDYLIAAMRERISNVQWMSEETRSEALAKLDGFGYKIGYPDEWRDYSDLEIGPGSWFDNRLAASRFEFARHIKKLGRPIDPHEWGMAPHVVNAYYHPLFNEIVFPAGILQPPFFDPDADAAVNYGGIGSVIGHEITHGFDDQGSKFDASGQMRDWWTESDREEFEERAAVLVDQFNECEVVAGLSVNGELTLGENIADLGGLHVAFDAMLAAQKDDGSEDIAGLSPTQRFFLSYARIWRQNYTEEYLRLIVNSDPHSPSDLRCNIPLSNMPSFTEAFAIPPDSPSTRPSKSQAQIW